MTKAAPGWGKAVGIIAICLGGLGVFYQMYKIIMPSFFRRIPETLNTLSQLDPNRTVEEEIAINQFQTIMGFTDGQATALMTFGVVGLVLTAFYIVGGAKLLKAKPSNYHFAKYALITFVVYNAILCLYIYTGNGSLILSAIGIYSLVGLVFDVTLMIIVLASDKADYGIGVDTSMHDYTLNPESEEII